MRAFEPDRVFFEPDALDYPLGKELYERFKRNGTPIHQTTSHNQVRGIPGDTELKAYRNAKRTLVVGIKRSLQFEPSLPSAEYAIPLATGCMGHCHYCYLQTTLGKKPYVRVYVNLEDIFTRAEKYIAKREPEITRFEAACTSDPVGIEHLTGSLGKTIAFMGQQENGRLRFVTKYDQVDSLLTIPHNGHTRIRFSVNARYVIRNFEPATAGLDERIIAAKKVAEVGYKVGFIVAPLIVFDGWEAEYEELFKKLSEKVTLNDENDAAFELIQHRYTKTAKETIQRRYPSSKLEMNEEERAKRYGRYGRVKYVYKKDRQQELKDHLISLVERYFPEARVDYFT